MQHEVSNCDEELNEHRSGHQRFARQCRGQGDPQGPEEPVERQRALLRAYGLPTDMPSGVDPARLLELTLRDKKVRAGRVRWVLPTALGAAEVRDDVPGELVRAVVEMAGAERSAE